MSDSVVTKKGTVLPLLNLKSKKYLMGAYRLQWMNEEVSKFEINTEFLLLTDEQTIARATLTIFDDNGNVLKKVTATKRETKKDFPDHTEKAESSAIFRCAALIGYGTQFALSDLDEGTTRIVDSPLESVKKSEPKKEEKLETLPEAVEEAPKKSGTFRKPKTVTPQEESEWG